MSTQVTLRKPYLQPRLVVYGNIQTLTRASGKLLMILDSGMGLLKTG
jgi:hypothetical protein